MQIKAILILLLLNFLTIELLAQDSIKIGKTSTPSAETVIGFVNGEPVTWKRYNDMVQLFVENQRKNFGEEIKSEDVLPFRDHVWDALVSEILLNSEMKKLGISVYRAEINSILHSNNPPELFKQNFTDSTGSFDRFAYEKALTDPRNKAAVAEAEEYISKQLLNKKIAEYLDKQIVVSENDMRNFFAKANIKCTADFARLEFSSIADSTIEITQEQLRKYYEANKKKLLEPEKRKIRYVVFPVVPSNDDSMAVYNLFKNTIGELQNNKYDFRTAAHKISEYPYSLDTLDITLLHPYFSYNLSQIKLPFVVGPVPFDLGLAIYNISEEVKGSVEFYRASHILIPLGNDITVSFSEANRVYSEIISGKIGFETAAAKYSKDLGSAANGGELGWFGKGRMVSEFESAVMNGQLNEIQKPVKTQFGWHIIKLTGKNSNRYLVERIYQSISPSMKVIENRYKASNEFVAGAMKNGFGKTAAEKGLEVTESSPLLKDNPELAGFGYATPIIHFAFDSPLNTLSLPLAVQGAYVVAMVSAIDSGGIPEFDKVGNFLKSGAIYEKKREAIRKQILTEITKVNNNIELLQENNQNIKIIKSIQFVPGNPIPSLGFEIQYSDSVFKTKSDEISSPILDSDAYLVMKISKITEFDEKLFALQKEKIKNKIIENRKEAFYNNWMQALKDKAKIIDRRYRVN